MSVRPAVESDTPEILRMADQFYATTSYAEWADFDPEHTMTMIALLLASGVLLVAEHEGQVVGMAGLIVGPTLCNAAVLMANEIMWWVDPGSRNTGAGIALLDAIQPACIAKGVTAIQMVRLRNSPPQAAAMYERRGYQHTESSYTLTVN